VGARTTPAQTIDRTSSDISILVRRESACENGFFYSLNT
jgi:hypothetical protein